MKGDRFGHSYHLGRFVIRDGKTYDEFGGILSRALEPHEVHFMYAEGTEMRENFADWPPEVSQAKREEYCGLLAQKRADEDRERRERRMLALSLKGRLAESEWQAIYQMGFEDGRDDE